MLSSFSHFKNFFAEHTTISIAATLTFKSEKKKEEKKNLKD